MGQDKEDGGQSRSAIPLVAGAIVTAQITMAAATFAGDKLTLYGIGRKPLFLAALASLPVRCALIIWLEDAGHAALLSTQIFDGLGGGLFGLVHPYLVADITFGTGRFNVLSELKTKWLAHHCFCRPRPGASYLYRFHSGLDSIVLWSGSDTFQLFRPNGGGKV